MSRDAPQGLPGLLRATRLRQPDEVATEDVHRSLTYAELDDVSDLLADEILAATGGTCGPVALVLPRGVDMLVAMYGVLKAGCWYLPVGVEEPADRVARMVQIAAPLLRIGGHEGLADAVAGVPALDVPGTSAARQALRPLPEVSADHPVYLMFTSGSTGLPKGVLVGSEAIVNRVLWMNDRYGLTPTDRVLQKTPYTFDVSGWELHCPLAAGARVVFLPEGEHREPRRVARFIRDRGITACHFVPSMLNEFLRQATSAEVAGVRLVYCSGEAMPARLCAQFATVFTAELHNLYGPTEAAIEVSYWAVPRTISAKDTVYIGRPIDNAVLLVVDEQGRPVPRGEVGELWIGGVPVALGYVNQAELTARAFPQVDGERYYRTGDLVRIVDGELEYLGRADGQLKVRGVRVEPGEVESALLRHPAVGQAAVVAVEADGSGSAELVAVLTPTASPSDAAADEVDLRDHLRRLLPPAFVPSRYHWVAELPTTTSGKADREALRRMMREQVRTRVAPVDGDEDPLAEIWWSELPEPPHGPDEQQGFLTLGGHSLLAIRILGRINAEFGAELPLTRLLSDNGTLASVRAAVSAAGGTGRGEESSGSPASSGPVPLPPAHRAIWLISRVHEERAAAYNVVAALRLRGVLDVRALTTAIEALVGRHESLRLRVVDGPDGPEFSRAVPSAVPIIDRREDRLDDDYLTAFVREVSAVPIPMDTAPMMTAGVVRDADGDSCVVISLHHLIADQRTLDLLLRDLADGYAAALPYAPAVRRPGPDAVPAGDTGVLGRLAAEVRRVDDAAWRRDLAYWVELLRDAPGETSLPFTRRTGQLPSLTGQRCSLELTPELSERVDAVCRAHAVTPFTLMLSSLAVVLRAWLDRDTLVLGMPVSQRRDPVDDEAVGFLLSTVPIRLDIPADTELTALLRHVQERCVEAMAHSAVSFDAIVRALGLPTQPTANPLFQVWVNDLSRAEPAPAFPGLRAEALRPVGHAALFDLNIYLRREPHYVLDLVVATERITPIVAQHVIGQIEQVLRQLVTAADAGDGPPVHLTQVSLAPADGWVAHRLDHVRASTTSPDERPGGVLDRIRVVADRTPEAIALRQADREITYRELLDRSTEVAAELAAAGIQPGLVVELRCRRSVELAWALLGAWAAGAVPALVDAGHPDALLAEYRALVEPAATVVVTESNGVRITGNGPGGRRIEEPAHVLFTSGTTGTAAPVLVPHTALTHNLDWYRRFVGTTDADRTMLAGGLGHDPVLRDLLVPLCAGGTVVVPPDGTLSAPARLYDFLRAERISLLHATPALLDVIVAGEREQADSAPRLDQLRLVMSGGAPLSAGLARRVRRLTSARLVNVYGSTETPQVASAQVVAETGDEVDETLADDTVLPFGSGVAGAELTVVDRLGRRCAVGQQGEIVVRGRHLARGYLGVGRSSEAFVAADETGRPGFRTGDLGRYDPCLNVQFSGRRDRLASINGFRVALEQVEAVALRWGRVEQCVAALTETALGSALVLRVVPRPGQSAPTGSEVRSYLRNHLPRYAVPAIVEIVAGLDVDLNHKVTGGIRPADTGQRTPVAEPGDRTLRELAAFAAEILGRPLGADTNFFDAGLDSISLIRFHEILTARLSRTLPVSALFAYPNLRALAEFLNSGSTSGLPAAPTVAADERPGGATASAAERRRVLRARLIRDDEEGARRGH